MKDIQNRMHADEKNRGNVDKAGLFEYTVYINLFFLLHGERLASRRKLRRQPAPNENPVTHILSLLCS